MSKIHVPKAAHKNIMAFRLLKYACASCNTEEVIWNSRDGRVLEFIPCQICGQRMVHLGIGHSAFNPEYCPQVGQRIFIDMPEEIKEPLARQVISAMYGKPYAKLSHPQKSEVKGILDLYPSGTPYLLTWK